MASPKQNIAPFSMFDRRIKQDDALVIIKKEYVELAERRLIYIRLANIELVKKNSGFKYSQRLIDACDAAIATSLALIEQQSKTYEPEKAIM